MQCQKTDVTCNEMDLSCNSLLAAIAFLYPPTGPRFVVSGDNGSIYTSHNGYDWSDEQVSGTSNNLASVAMDHGHFVAQGVLGTTIFSNDGINWNAATISGAGSLQATIF